MNSTFKVFCGRSQFDNMKEVDLKIIEFSDGTVQCQFVNDDITFGKNLSVFKVVARIVDSDGIMALFQIKDIIDHYCQPDFVTLDLSYIPYARYDRRMTKTDSFSLGVFAKMINSLNFNEVLVDDSHSQVAIGVLDRCFEAKDQLAAINALGLNLSNMVDYIVSPDIGAYKKAASIAYYFNLPIIVATKTRNVETGYLEFDGLDLRGVKAEDLKDKTLLIVDDLADGGYTFTQLGGVLKKYNPSTINLFVTHGIFSKGRKLENIDNIFMYNDINSLISKSEG